jgi:hypothetical protein
VEYLAAGGWISHPSNNSNMKGRKMRRLFVLFGFFAAVSALFASTAQAAPITGSGYVCEVRYSPGPSTLNLGRYGYLSVTIHGGPNCTGGSLVFGVVHSTSATDGDPQYHYSELGLMGLYNNLYQAAVSDKKVSYSAEGVPTANNFFRTIILTALP